MYKKFTTFQTEQVRNKIQDSITSFFNSFRDKIDLLENKTVDSIHNSTNLNDLVNTLEKVTEKLEADKILEKYEDRAKLLKSKINEGRYAYLCTRRESYRKVVEEIRADNTVLQNNIDKVLQMIDSIFEVNKDFERIENVVNSLVSDMMLIDEKKPDFGYQLREGQSLAEALEKDYSVVKSKKASQTTEKYLSEEMNAFYIAKDGYLYCREFEEGEFIETKIIPLKLHLQKIITVPREEENDVYFIGGAEDEKAVKPIASCFKLDHAKKTLVPVRKMFKPK